MLNPSPSDSLPPDRAARQKAHLHNRGTDALARAVEESAPPELAMPRPTPELPPVVDARVNVEQSPYPAAAAG